MVMSGNAFMDLIAPALGVETAKVRRIVLDAEVGHVLKVYIEGFGDTRLLSITFPPINAELITMQGNAE
jgi:hypothetical protein